MTSFEEHVPKNAEASFPDDGSCKNIYDCEIEDSFINDCNLFGYSDCVESKFKNCFISNNIKLENSSVFGALGKFAGIINSGSIKNTTVIASMADIGDKVKKLNINEIN